MPAECRGRATQQVAQCIFSGSLVTRMLLCAFRADPLRGLAPDDRGHQERIDGTEGREDNLARRNALGPAHFGVRAFPLPPGPPLARRHGRCGPPGPAGDRVRASGLVASELAFAALRFRCSQRALEYAEPRPDDRARATGHDQFAESGPTIGKDPHRHDRRAFRRSGLDPRSEPRRTARTEQLHLARKGPGLRQKPGDPDRGRWADGGVDHLSRRRSTEGRELPDSIGPNGTQTLLQIDPNAFPPDHPTGGQDNRVPPQAISPPAADTSRRAPRPPAIPRPPPGTVAPPST